MINWEKLAIQFGTIEGSNENVSSVHAQMALESFIGEENIKNAIDHYIRFKPGSELIRMILWQIHSWIGMQYCYHIYKNEENIDYRIRAVELLRVISDKRALPWIKEFLSDANPDIQSWGIGILDQLLWAELVSIEDSENIFLIAENHPNIRVRETFELIQSYIADRD